MNCAIIDDSNIISHIMISALKPYGFQSTHFRSNDIDDMTFPFNKYNLLIVNSSVSNLDSNTFISKIRKKNRNSYILGVITKGDWKEKVSMLQSGADDVLNYPFPLQELIARIQNLINRPKDKIQNRYQIGETVIDIDSRRVILNDRSVYLRNKEFGILEYLTRNNERAISRSEILDHVWDYRTVSSSNTVDVHVSNIRKKLDGVNLIKTVHGFGYKIEDEPDDAASNESKEPEDLTTIS